MARRTAREVRARDIPNKQPRPGVSQSVDPVIGKTTARYPHAPQLAPHLVANVWKVWKPLLPHLRRTPSCHRRQTTDIVDASVDLSGSALALHLSASLPRIRWIKRHRTATEDRLPGDVRVACPGSASRRPPCVILVLCHASAAGNSESRRAWTWEIRGGRLSADGDDAAGHGNAWALTRREGVATRMA